MAAAVTTHLSSALGVRRGKDGLTRHGNGLNSYSYQCEVLFFQPHSVRKRIQRQCVIFSIAWVYRTAVLFTVLVYSVFNWALSEVVSTLLFFFLTIGHRYRR